MKIPSIQSTFSQIRNYRKKKDIAELNRLTDLSGAFGDAHSQLLSAQEGLANYAKAKNIRISFNNMLLKDFMDITVTHTNGKQAKSTINAKTDELETVERSVVRMLEDKDGVNYIGHGVESHEDNFLRRVYRTVEMLTNSIKQ